MYPFIRLGKTLAKSFVAHRQGHDLKITDTSEIKITTQLHDIDNFVEMNNGRIFTLFDLGRFDFAMRTGLIKSLLKHRWGLVVAGSSIQYRKRIRLFDRVTIKTRLVAIDTRWLYVEQSMWVKGQPACVALLRTGVTNFKTGKVIETQMVLDALDMPDFKMPPDTWVQAWIDADKLRPFPKADATS